MVLRIAGLPYQKGFGGHFHNDNSLAVFRDIPGLVIAVPSCGREAVLMLRECVRLAHEEQRVVIFVEPIALYMMRDLHSEGDGLWTSVYEAPGVCEIRVGEIGVHGEGTDLAIVTYGNGVYLSLQAQKLLAKSANSSQPTSSHAPMTVCSTTSDSNCLSNQLFDIHPFHLRRTLHDRPHRQSRIDEFQI
jgi:2-oxoisovalerate dehydrogenase E1 component